MSEKRYPVEKFQMLAGKALIKKTPVKEITESGLYTMEDSRNFRCIDGIVVAMGPPVKLKSGVDIDPGFKVGERVLFSAMAGNEAPAPFPEDHLVIPFEEIRAVLDSDAKVEIVPTKLT